MGKDESGMSAIEQLEASRKNNRRGGKALHFAIRLHEHEVNIILQIRKKYICNTTEAIRMALKAYKI